MKISKIICAGFGGQGVMSMGRLIAYTGMLENQEVSWLPSYGPEMRGGTANCNVIVSDHSIGSPVISKDADAAIVMNLPSMRKFEPELVPGGLLVVNTSLIDAKPMRDDIEIVEVRANEIATEVGNAKAANMVMLGAYIGVSGLFEIDSVLEALKKVFGPKKAAFLEVNRNALNRGRELVAHHVS
ncbi:MAG: 2-oxoacid:acceptor oxidoreductase family protein [Alkalispirochaeta sp.]